MGIILFSNKIMESSFPRVSCEGCFWKPFRVVPCWLQMCWGLCKEQKESKSGHLFVYLFVHVYFVVLLEHVTINVD